MDPYWRLLCAGIRPDCAAETVDYFNANKTPEELEAYVQEIENRREVSDR